MFIGLPPVNVGVLRHHVDATLSRTRMWLLAARAVVHDASLDTYALIAPTDQGTTAPAGQAGTLVHPGTPTSGQLTGGRALHPPGITAQQRPRQRDGPHRIRQLRNRRPRPDTEQETQLATIYISNARHHPLIQQDQPELGSRVGGQPAQHLPSMRLTPAGVEQVRAEMTDQAVLLAGPQQGQVVQPEAHRDAISGGEHRPGVVAGVPPPLAREVELPRAVHPQMAMQAATMIEPDEQMLAHAAHPSDPLPGQVVLHQPRVPQLAPHQLLPTQRRIQPPGRSVHGVTLGHSTHPAARDSAAVTESHTGAATKVGNWTSSWF
jgi:hypothetical protein